MDRKGRFSRVYLEGLHRMKGLVPIARKLKVSNYGRLSKDELVTNILKYQMGFLPVRKKVVKVNDVELLIDGRVPKRRQLEALSKGEGLIPLARKLSLTGYVRMDKSTLVDKVLEAWPNPIKMVFNREGAEVTKKTNFVVEDGGDAPTDVGRPPTFDEIFFNGGRINGRAGAGGRAPSISVDQKRVYSVVRATGFLNEDLTTKLYNRMKPLMKTAATLVYSFSAVIYDGQGLYRVFHKTLPNFTGLNTKSELEKAIARCEEMRLDLSNELVWSGSYIPPIGMIQDQAFYRGVVEFNEVRIKLFHSGEPLIGAGKIVEWMKHSKTTYAPPEKNDNMCFWRCLAAFYKVKDLKRLERSAKDIARRCLKTEVRGKKVSMDVIAEAARVMGLTIVVFNPVWQNGGIVCEFRARFGAGERVMNIGIVGGHCYLIKDLDSLCKIWRCEKCSLVFNKSSNLKRHRSEVEEPQSKYFCHRV